MDQQQTTRISKFLSLVLRHHPELIGIVLDEQGWTDVATLLVKARPKLPGLDMASLEHVVATSPKQRFAFDSDKARIRASQGHSVAVELGYSATEPPASLYHGTVPRFLDAIRRDGLLKMSRHHVHLSKDLETAESVAKRRGEAVILHVRAGEMHAAGHEFFVSENGVWLTDHVPPQFIDFE